MPVKSDIPTLPEHSSGLTASDVNALVQSNVKLIQLLEQINSNLEPLKEIKEECAAMREYVREDLVDEVVRRAVVDKQLDITNEQSKLAGSLKDISSLLKTTADKLNKTIWVIILCVTLLGGVRVIGDFMFPKSKTSTESHNNLKITPNGRVYITTPAGDTLWVAPDRP